MVDSRPKVVPGPDVEDGRICHTSQGIRIPIEAGAKLTQEFPHATEEWRTVYNALRNAIEGLNGH